VSNCIIYILYYILGYIQHNGDVSFEKILFICNASVKDVREKM